MSSSIPRAQVVLLRLLSLGFLACASAPVGPGPLAAPTEAPAARIVLVTIDTLRADHVGSYGAQQARTRTLDDLARRGTRFATAISPTPQTLPSHTSILTGRDPVQHGVHANGVFELSEEVATLAEQLRGQGFATAAFVASAVLDRRYGLARGFDHYDDEMSFRRTAAVRGGVAERRADEVLDRAIAWLGNAPERFFLWVHLYDPHGSYAPPPGFVRLPSGPRPDPQRIGLLRFSSTWLSHFYDGEIYYTDTELGRLFRSIDRRWNDGGTLFVVTSDHGESLGEHGELTHTLTVYDATQHVPLLMAGPRVPAGRVVDATVRLADVAPTILAIADAPALPGATGQDLQPWMRGERDDSLDAYVQTLSTYIDYAWSPVLGLRNGRFEYLRTTRPELYDVLADPEELHDIAGSRPDVVAELDARLERRLAGARPLQMRAPPTSSEREMLESLGYVLSSEPKELPALGSVGGPDPKDRLGAVVDLIAAQSYLADGKLEEAQAALSATPEAGGWVARVRAEIEQALGNHVVAEREARKMVELQPGYAEGYLVLGDALASQGRLDEAREAYALASRADPSQSDSLVALGVLEEGAGNLDAAIAHYETVLASRSPHADAALRLATIRFSQHRPEAAEELLEGATMSSASPAAAIALLRAEAAAGRPEDALKRARRARRAASRPALYDDVLRELAEAAGQPAM